MVKNIYLVKKRHANAARLDSILDSLSIVGKGVMILVAAAVIISGFWFGRDFLLVSPCFNLKNIKINGNENVSCEEIINLSDIKLCQNIFKLNLAKIQNLIKQNPMFSHVYVKRHVPDTIEISVRERKPIVLLNVKGDIYQVDEEGVIFQKLSLPMKFNLPIINNIKLQDIALGEKSNSVILNSGIGILKDIMVSDAVLMDDISELQLKSLDEIIVYTNKGIKIKVDEKTEKHKWLFVNRVINIAANDKINIDYLDLRYREQIILKPSV